MVLTIMGTATTWCITARTLAGTTLVDSMVGTVGSTEVGRITESAGLLARQSQLCLVSLHDPSA
jgi:hypothetical protein